MAEQNETNNDPSLEATSNKEISANEILQTTPYLRAPTTKQQGVETTPSINWKQEIEVKKHLEASKSSGAALWDAAKENEQLVPALARLNHRGSREFEEAPIELNDDDIKNLMESYTPDERDYLTESKTDSEFSLRKFDIDQDRARTQVVNEHGYTGVAASMGAAIIDIPVALVGVALGTATGGTSTLAATGQKLNSFGKILNSARKLGGTKTLGTALRSGSVTAAEAAAIEAVLMQADTQRDLNDFILNVGGSAVFGAAIGVAGRSLKKKGVAESLDDASIEIKKEAAVNSKESVYSKMDEAGAATHKMREADVDMPNTFDNLSAPYKRAPLTNSVRKANAGNDPVLLAKLDADVARAGTDIIELDLHAKAQKRVNRITRKRAEAKNKKAVIEVKKTEVKQKADVDEGDKILAELDETIAKAEKALSGLRKANKSKKSKIKAGKKKPFVARQEDAQIVQKEIKAAKAEKERILKQQNNKIRAANEAIGAAKFREDLSKGKLRDQDEAIKAKSDYKEWSSKTQEAKNKEVFGTEKPTFKENEPVPSKAAPTPDQPAPTKSDLGDPDLPANRESGTSDPRDAVLVSEWEKVRDISADRSKWLKANREEVIASWSRNVSADEEFSDQVLELLSEGRDQTARIAITTRLKSPDTSIDPDVGISLYTMAKTDKTLASAVIEDMTGIKPASNVIPTPKRMTESDLDDLMKEDLGIDAIDLEGEAAIDAPVDRFKGTHDTPESAHDFLSESPSTDEVFSWFDRAFKGSEFSAIAKQIKPFVSPELKIKLATPDNLRDLVKSEGNWVYAIKTNSMGLHNNALSTILIRGEKLGPHKLDVPKTLLHEMLHNATVNGYHKGMADYNSSRMAKRSGKAEELTPQARAFKDVWSLHQALVTHVTSTTQKGVRLPHHIRAGLQNPKELITWGMTDHNFKSYLQSIKLSDIGQTEVSAWSAFTKAMRSLLGLKNKTSTAYDELLNRTDTLMQVNPRIPGEAPVRKDNRMVLDDTLDSEVAEGEGVFEYNENASKILTKLADEAPDQVNTAVLNKGDGNLISNAIQSVYTTIDISGNRFIRGLGSVLLENPQGNKTGVKQTADVWSRNFDRRIRTAVGNRINTGFTAYSASKGIGRIRSMLDASDLKKSFDAEIQTVIKTQNFEDLSPGVKDAAEGYIDGYAMALKLRKESGETGMKNVESNPSYLPNIYSGQGMQKMAAELGQDSVLELLAKGFRNGGVEMSDSASKVLARLTYDNGVGRTIRTGDFNPDNILSTANLDMFKKEMKSFGATDEDIAALTEGMADARKFASNRTKRSVTIDWEAEIGGYKVADLMQNDMDKLFESYVRDSAGYASLNKVGINSPSHANYLVDQSIRMAVNEEPTLNVAKLSAEGKQLKEAVSLLMGRSIEGDSEDLIKGARRLRSLTHSLRLTQVGFASVGEASRAITFAGLGTVMSSVRGLGAFRWNGKVARSADLKHKADDMREIEEILGFVGEDTWMNTIASRGEDFALNDGGMGRVFDNGLAGLSHINHFTSLFQNLQGGLEKISTRAVSTKMKDILRSGKFPTSKGMQNAFNEVGLDPDTFSEISNWMKANPKTADFNGRTLNLFNFEEMPVDMRDKVTVAMQRLGWRMMQRNFVGDSSIFMNKTLGKTLTQFKSFSIISLEKQLMHDVKADKIMASQTLMWSTMLSYMAYQAQANAKAAMISKEEDREEYLDRLNDPRNVAFGIFNKSNQLAFLGIGGDVLASFGLLPDDLLFTPGKGSGFSGRGVGAMIPMIGTLDEGARLVKSVKDAAFNDDKGAADVLDQLQKSLPLGNSIGIGHAISAAANAIR